MISFGSIKGASQRRGILFVADRVMHYHVATMKAIESRLAEKGIPFAILSAYEKDGVVGRVGLRDKVVGNHARFRLRERKVGRFQLRYQHGLVDLVRRNSPAVVMSMCHSGTLTEWLLLKWARRNGVRSVAWQCGYEYTPSRLKRLALARFIPLFDFHLCYHTNAQKYAIEHGAAGAQTLVMHNTIDERAIQTSDVARAKGILSDRYPLLRDKKIVLYVGAVLEEKRLELVFEALARMNRVDTVFLVVGDGPHLSALKARFADRPDWLSTGSIVEGVGVYFDAADIFVLPGTGGLAINEAMAHRLPVVSGYADGSADDLVIDGVTGYRLLNVSAIELAERLADLLDDPVRARDLGAEGERRIRGPLSFESFIDRVVGVLEAQHALAT